MPKQLILQGRDYFDKNINFCINKGYGSGHSHSHDFIEIAYVFRGKGIHYFEDQEFSVSKGDMFIINNDTNHCFKSLDSNSDQFLVYNCFFWPDFLDETLSSTYEFNQVAKHLISSSFITDDITKSRIRFQAEEAIKVERLFTDMYIEYSSKDKGHIEMIKSYIKQLFITIFRTYEKSHFYTPIQIQSQENLVAQVIDYLHIHYNKSVQLKDLSQELFTSKSTLCKTFKECTGTTITKYIQERRITSAKELLKSTDRKVIDIAKDVGYKDLKHFNYIFKKFTGKSPSKYRNSSY